MRKPFTPTEIIFAPTTRCNLACGHCRVRRDGPPGKGELSAEDATQFLEEGAANGIERVGFSGGEPFLAPAFLEAICLKAVDLALYFDRLMTNGVWYKDKEELESVLGRIFDSGFDGTIGISADDWHAQDPVRLAAFIGAVGEISGRYDSLEIISVRDRDGRPSIPLLEKVARALDSELVLDQGQPAAIRNRQWLANRDGGMDDGSGINIPITLIPYSAGASDDGAWGAAKWFTDDWCEGPGNIFYVHPDGSAAVCCGFANERPELSAGNIREGFDSLLAAARANAHIRDCYERGLGARRKELEKSGTVFPGRTEDICFFCEYLCKNGLAAKN